MTARPASGAIHGGGTTDFSTRLDELQQHVTQAKSAAQTAASKSPELNAIDARANADELAMAAGLLALA